MANINKTSIRIPSQLPEFIRDDVNYENFVAFVEAYYEWLELSNVANSASTLINSTNQGATFGLKNLLNYSDVDNTLDDFINYYINDFLPNFPEDMLADKVNILKLARQLYKSKGTPASYKLLFRILYNSNAELLFTKGLVFRASSGEWYIPKYLKLKTENLLWLSPVIKNLRLFGETSKSFCVIENSVNTNKIDKVNIYISQIERLFLSGELVRVVDSGNRDVYFKDGKIVPEGTPGSATLTGKVVGAISSVNINKKYRGLKYHVGDPVVVYGGLNEPNGIRATAEVSETTKGSIQRLNLINGGHGYRVSPNSTITFTGGGGSGAEAHVQTINPNEIANVTFVGTDVIALKSHIYLDSQYYFAANTIANSNCSLANAFSFTSFSTYPIDSVITDNGGGGYSDIPTITADSLYFDELPSSNTHNLASVGILAPIQIISSGLGYMANDVITFTGGSGTGAFANVISVDGSGRISEISYIPNYLTNEIYPLGGMGYNNISLPSLGVLSANVSAHGANVQVSSILGTGATFNAETDRIGSITKIKINESGEDYIATPNVSFKVQDLVVTGVQHDLSSILPGTPLYQGTDIDIDDIDLEVFSYVSYVDSITILKSTADPLTDVYMVRVYNPLGAVNYTLPLYADIDTGVYPSMQLSNEYDGIVGDPQAYHNGVKTYGNGTARGSAKFLNGLIFGEGRYLNTTGQPSSYSVLQSSIHNDFTYVLSVEKPISQYRDILKRLIHPAGTRIIGRDLLKNERNFSLHGYRGQGLIESLQYWTGWPVGDRNASVLMRASGALSNSGISIVLPGNGYNSITTTVQISPPNLTNGVQATAIANVVNGLIKSVYIMNPGSGYTSPIITIVDSTTRSGNANAYVTAWPITYSNTITVNSEAGPGMFNYLANTDFITIDDGIRPIISSRIKTLDGASGTITLDDDVFLTLPNVAYAYSNISVNKIQISSFSIANTPNYDIINSGEYSDANNHIKDIVFVGDNITIGGNTYVIKSVDYDNHLLTIVNEAGIIATNPDGSPIYTEDGANNILVGSFIFNIGSESSPVPFTINRTISTTKAFIRKAN